MSLWCLLSQVLGGGTLTDIQTYRISSRKMRPRPLIMAITKGAKIGHTTSKLLPSFCSVSKSETDSMLSVSLLSTITKNCAGQWLGQTGVDYVCVQVLTLHRCVHARCVCVFICACTVFACVCVYVCVCACAVCLAASRGCGIFTGGRLGCVCVPTAVLRSGRERRWSSQWHLRAGWLAGWQQQTASAQ